MSKGLPALPVIPAHAAKALLFSVITAWYPGISHRDTR